VQPDRTVPSGPFENKFVLSHYSSAVVDDLHQGERPLPMT
jgi:hypothetical protein